MSVREFQSWKAFYRVSPWGDERADWRIGRLAQMYATVHRAPGVLSPKLAEFLWQYEAPPPPRMSDEDIWACVQHWANMNKRQG